jgi:O-antigen/teichoic acid export membrane protein
MIHGDKDRGVISWLRDLVRKPFLRALVAGVGTQGILSATSFLIKVLVAQRFAKSDLALFETANSTVLIFLSFQNALINTPLIVLLPEKRGEARDNMLSGLAFGQALGVIPVLLLGCLAVLGYLILGGGALSPWWLVAVALATLTAFTREYNRVLYFCELRVGRVVLMDAVFSALTIFGVFLMARAGAYTSARLVALHAATYLVSAVFGHVAARRKYRFDRKTLMEALRETWQYSRWGLLGVVTHNVQTYAYIYLVTLLADLDKTADISAARMLLAPFGLLIGSTQRVFITKGSEIRFQESPHQLLRHVLGYAGFLVGIWACYVLLLYLFHTELIRYVFTDKYANIGPYVLWWAVFFLLYAVDCVVTFTLQALKEFKRLALLGVVSSASVLVLCVVLLLAIGPVGSLFAGIAGEVVIIATLLPRLVKRLRAPVTVDRPGGGGAA